jgi:hypothetical protein
MKTFETSDPISKNPHNFPDSYPNILFNLPSIQNSNPVYENISDQNRRLYNNYVNKCKLMHLYKTYIGLDINSNEKIIFDKDLLNEILISTIKKKTKNKKHHVDILTSFGVEILYIPANQFSEINLTEITIPDSVITIGDNAFRNNQLVDVIMSNFVTSIREHAFSNNKLTEIIIPNSVIIIGNYAFSNNQLIDVIIPNSVKTIGDGAFNNNKLIKITISNLIKSINHFIFENTNECLFLQSNDCFST